MKRGLNLFKKNIILDRIRICVTGFIFGVCAVLLLANTDYKPATEEDYQVLEQQAMEFIPQQAKCINSDKQSKSAKITLSSKQCSVKVTYGTEKGTYNVERKDKAVSMGSVIIQLALICFAIYWGSHFFIRPLIFGQKKNALNELKDDIFGEK